VSAGRYDCSADIWSFGITLLEFALGQAPLQNCNLDQILMKTLNEPPPILESSDRRKRFTEVIRSGYIVSMHCLFQKQQTSELKWDDLPC
jgi:serine/threonine protein kinase